MQNVCECTQVNANIFYSLCSLYALLFTVNNIHEKLLDSDWLRSNISTKSEKKNIFCNVSLMTMEYVQIRVNCRSSLVMFAGMVNP